MSNNSFTILCSGNAPWLYPTDTVFGLLWYSKEDALEIPKRHPYTGEWGQVLSTLLLIREEYPIPNKLNLLWLSITENKFYEIETSIPVEKIENLWRKYENEEIFSHIVVGMAPFGKVACWLNGFKKSNCIFWETGQEIPYSRLSSFQPAKECFDNRNLFLNSDLRVRDNLQKNGLPDIGLFDNYMKQFNFRYMMLFEHWDKDKNEWKKYGEEDTMPEFNYIEEALYDGTHDKLHNEGLMNYHQAGKPKKLAVAWHIKKSEYTAYFWFEDEEIRAVFDRFYGAHPDTKTDFMIRIDAEKNKYELALYRYGLKEPQVISESAYQLLVFKNKFEYYRSANYNQPRGAWIW